MKTRSKNAFTLVEVMIVIFIIALLCAIAIPNYRRSQIYGAAKVRATNAVKAFPGAIENSVFTSYSGNTKFEEQVYDAKWETINGNEYRGRVIVTKERTIILVDGTSHPPKHP